MRVIRLEYGEGQPKLEWIMRLSDWVKQGLGSSLSKASAHMGPLAYL